MTHTLLTAAGVVTPEQVLAPGWVRLSGGTIAEVGAGRPATTGVTVDLDDSLLLPGFVDLHVHGGGGASFGGGRADVETAVAFHRAHGTTTTNASLVSTSPDVLLAQVESLAGCVEDGLVAGIHLEGPWLSRRRCGAHDPAVLRDPTPVEVDALLAAARTTLRMVTLAPERPGAMEAIRRLRAAGVSVAIGHTEADDDVVRSALAAGATVATHLFNAMPAVHHRHPGPVPALLTDPATVVELICDGVHLHDAVVRLAVQVAGPDRVALVTDAIAAAGSGDGEVRLGALPVRVVDGTARLVDGGALAGSTLTMDAAVRRAVSLGVPLVDAARMASTVPARVLRQPDRGRIAAGCRADLVLLGPDLEVRRVMHGGDWV